MREPFPHRKAWTWIVSRFGLTVWSALRPVVVIRLRFRVLVYNARGQLSILRGDVEGAMDYFALSSSLDSSELNPGSQMMMDFSQLQN